MQRAEISLEPFHVYNGDAAASVRGVDLSLDFIDHVNPSVQICTAIMVDDYHTSSTVEEALELALDLGVDPDWVVPEACFAEVAGDLVESLRASQLENDDGLWYRADRMRIRLRHGGRWTCEALAACWHLARLGAEPWHGCARSHGKGTTPLGATRSVSFLPTRFLPTEARAFELIRCAQSKTVRKKAKRMSWRFF